MRSRITPLIKLLYNPLQAMAELAIRAPYLWAALFALVATMLYYDALGGDLWVLLSPVINGAPAAGLSTIILHVFERLFQSVAPVLFIAAVFVPACLLAASLLERRASFSVMLRQEYAALASCALYSWTAAHLMMLVPALLLFTPDGPNVALREAALRLVPLPYFVFLIVLALRVVVRVSYGRAVGVVALAALSLVALPLVPRLLFLLTSPFLLILVILVLRNLLGDVLSAQRAREEFKQNLEAATLNPADASAHYNLGLVYQQRGQFAEAKQCFRRAIEIDPDETDAHYQLGRIAREQGELTEAIAHFDAVVRRSSEHSQNEIWREIGRTYFQAGQFDDARASFERFLEKRPSDAEGRYRYGLTLHRLGRATDAAVEMRACIEAVRTAPAYKYRAEKRWMNEAQSFLRSQVAGSQ
jgi:tetratricopeptide (TPR) repeat protein